MRLILDRVKDLIQEYLGSGNPSQKQARELRELIAWIEDKLTESP
jgi:hypothetical protein